MFKQPQLKRSNLPLFVKELHKQDVGDTLTVIPTRETIPTTAESLDDSTRMEEMSSLLPPIESTEFSFHALRRRQLFNSTIGDWQQEWKGLHTEDRFLAVVGLFMAFLFCWCFMTCLCNSLRAALSCCGCGNRRRPQRYQYTEIDPRNGRTIVYRDTASYYYPNEPYNARPCRCINLLWATCCFECCCRNNQDVGNFDCCQLCCPLLALECCCPV